MFTEEMVRCTFFSSASDSSLPTSDQAWQDKLRNRPILTGHIRASLSNKPLPRLKPQPSAISVMIYKRRAERQRRVLKLKELEDWQDDLRREAAFEDSAFRSENMGNGVAEGCDENPSEGSSRVFGYKMIAKWGALVLRLR
jgi:hypothetical protein